LLAKEVVARFPEKVRFVEEDFASSELAEEHGITRYPAFFVDGHLFAGPRDFYAWGEKVEPKYAPWTQAEKRDRFQEDLEESIQRGLSGVEPAAAAKGVAGGSAVEHMPAFAVRDLEGQLIRKEDLLGKVTMIEFWATWCPPCAHTVPWVAEAARRHAGQVQAISIALSSPEDKVRARAAEFDTPMRWVIADDALNESFGPVNVLPTLYVFDREQRLVGTFIGAPPDVHTKVQRLLSELVEAPLGPDVGSAADRLTHEVSELREIAGKLSVERSQPIAAQLDDVERLLSEDRMLAAIAALSTPVVDALANAYMQSMQKKIADMDAFDSLWKKADRELHGQEEAFEIHYRQRPLALQGMAEVSRQAARPYAESAKLYAESDSIASGLFYLGRAIGHMRYALLCSQLALHGEPGAELSGDPAKLVEELEARTQAAFKTAADPEWVNRRLLAVNAYLKTIHALQRERRSAGALYLSLQARLLLDAELGEQGDAPELDELLPAWEESKAGLDDLTGDPSLARLYSQEVGSLLEDEEPSTEDLRRAQVILDEVLPALLVRGGR
jgi:thiol-disulfide isomerase/thioredoxin